MVGAGLLHVPVHSGGEIQTVPKSSRHVNAPLVAFRIITFSRTVIVGYTEGCVVRDLLVTTRHTKGVGIAERILVQ